MQNIENHIDDLIGKYLSGESTVEETRFIESWIRVNENNRKYFDQIKAIYTRAAAITKTQHFDEDAAWNKVKAKLQNSRQAKTIPIKPATDYSVYWKIAASIILVLGIGFFTYQAFKTSPTIEVVADKKPEADTLPDGSGVFLNRQTTLAYEFDKKKKTHVVKLKGEAYFNINSNDDKQFVVRAEEVFIKDIGTSFNVKAYPDSNTIEVVVEEGEVMLYTESDSGVYLKTGGKGVYNKLTKKFTVEAPEPNVTAYKTKFFIFSDSDLASVVKTINEVYSQKITISEKLQKCRLTATFNNESPEEMADVIAETLGLTVKSSGQQIVLDGPGCED